jgi:hypothetical protein
VLVISHWSLKHSWIQEAKFSGLTVLIPRIRLEERVLCPLDPFHAEFITAREILTSEGASSRAQQPKTAGIWDASVGITGRPA